MQLDAREDTDTDRDNLSDTTEGRRSGTLKTKLKSKEPKFGGAKSSDRIKKRRLSASKTRQIKDRDKEDNELNSTELPEATIEKGDNRKSKPSPKSDVNGTPLRKSDGTALSEEEEHSDANSLMTEPEGEEEKEEEYTFTYFYLLISNTK